MVVFSSTWLYMYRWQRNLLMNKFSIMWVACTHRKLVQSTHMAWYFDPLMVIYVRFFDMWHRPILGGSIYYAMIFWLSNCTIHFLGGVVQISPWYKSHLTLRQRTRIRQLFLSGVHFLFERDWESGRLCAVNASEFPRRLRSCVLDSERPTLRRFRENQASSAGPSEGNYTGTHSSNQQLQTVPQKLFRPWIIETELNWWAAGG